MNIVNIKGINTINYRDFAEMFGVPKEVVAYQIANNKNMTLDVDYISAARNNYYLSVTGVVAVSISIQLSDYAKVASIINALGDSKSEMDFKHKYEELQFKYRQIVTAYQLMGEFISNAECSVSESEGVSETDVNKHKNSVCAGSKPSLLDIDAKPTSNLKIRYHSMPQPTVVEAARINQVNAKLGSKFPGVAVPHGTLALQRMKFLSKTYKEFEKTGYNFAMAKSAFVHKYNLNPANSNISKLRIIASDRETFESWYKLFSAMITEMD
jgi:hypothetical protein